MAKEQDPKKAPPTKVKSLESFNRLNQLETQNYEKLRNKCLKNGTLWEDNLFPAVSASFYCKECKIEFKWLRPFQIKTNPKFYGNQNFPFKLNITQGNVGNFWFLGALAALSLNKDIFEQVVPIDQTFDAPNYAGIYQFRFWYFGKWRTVLVDDRLPTLDGALIMSHDKDLNEFWCSLLEKAYAKMLGCYEAMVGSYLSDALEDFTGGISEFYCLKPNEMPSNLFSIVYKSILRSSLICSCIETEDKQITQLDNGLYKNNFYTLTAVNSIELENEPNPIQLVRVRNSWSSTSDWKGSWGCKSREWSLIPEQDKEHFGLVLEYDGEFWMTFDDFKANFIKIDICNIVSDKSNQAKFKWEAQCNDGTWEPGTTAGGCTNVKTTFYKNPRYGLFVSSKDCDPDDAGYATVLVALMQKYRRSKKRSGLFDLKIGFQIYSVEASEPADNNKKVDVNTLTITPQYFATRKPTAGTKCYINIREVFGRYRLKPGNYMVIPSTFQANRKGSFLLRFFTEKIDNSVDLTYSFKPRFQSKEFLSKHGLFKTPVDKMGGENKKIDATALYNLFKEDIVSERICFTLDQCRLLIVVYDDKKEGHITIDQFRALCIDVNECYQIFAKYNKQAENVLTPAEIKKSFDEMGIYAGPSILDLIMCRYGSEIKSTTGGGSSGGGAGVGVDGTSTVNVNESKNFNVTQGDSSVNASSSTNTPVPNSSSNVDASSSNSTNTPSSSSSVNANASSVNPSDSASSTKSSGSSTSDVAKRSGSTLVNRHKNRAIDFCNFAICAFKLRNLILFWDAKVKKEDAENQGSSCSIRGSRRIIPFTLREFVEQMMYS